MTNSMIILSESIRLMQEGILSGSGIFGTYTDREGNEKQIELPEQIHTHLIRRTWKVVQSFRNLKRFTLKTKTSGILL